MPSSLDAAHLMGSRNGSRWAVCKICFAELGWLWAWSQTGRSMTRSAKDLKMRVTEKLL